MNSSEAMAQGMVDLGRSMSLLEDLDEKEEAIAEIVRMGVDGLLQEETLQGRSDFWERIAEVAYMKGVEGNFLFSDMDRFRIIEAIGINLEELKKDPYSELLAMNEFAGDEKETGSYEVNPYSRVG